MLFNQRLAWTLINSMSLIMSSLLDHKSRGMKTSHRSPSRIFDKVIFHPLTTLLTGNLEGIPLLFESSVMVPSTSLFVYFTVTSEFSLAIFPLPE